MSLTTTASSAALVTETLSVVETLDLTLTIQHTQTTILYPSIAPIPTVSAAAIYTTTYLTVSPVQTMAVGTMAVGSAVSILAPTGVDAPGYIGNAAVSPLPLLLPPVDYHDQLVELAAQFGLPSGQSSGLQSALNTIGLTATVLNSVETSPSLQSQIMTALHVADRSYVPRFAPLVASYSTIAQTTVTHLTATLIGTLTHAPLGLVGPTTLLQAVGVPLTLPVTDTIYAVESINVTSSGSTTQYVSNTTIIPGGSIEYAPILIVTPLNANNGIDQSRPITTVTLGPLSLTDIDSASLDDLATQYISGHTILLLPDNIFMPSVETVRTIFPAVTNTVTQTLINSFAALFPTLTTVAVATVTSQLTTLATVTETFTIPGSVSIGGATSITSPTNSPSGGGSSDSGTTSAPTVLPASVAAILAPTTTVSAPTNNSASPNPTGPTVAVDAAITTLKSGVTLTGTVKTAAGVTVSSVEIFEGTTSLGAATVDPSTGIWTYDFSQPAGFHTDLSVVATDSQGLRVSAPSYFDLTIRIKGEPYRTIQDNYDPVTYAYTGSTYFKPSGTVYLQSSYAQTANGDPVYTYTAGSFFGGLAFTSFVDTYDASGELIEHVENNIDGSHAIEADGAYQRILGLGTDTLAADGSNTRFVLYHGIGDELITGFQATGADHDMVSLPNSDAIRLAGILAHATSDNQGNTTLKLGRDDTLTFVDISREQLQKHAKDFVFHS